MWERMFINPYVVYIEGSSLYEFSSDLCTLCDMRFRGDIFRGFCGRRIIEVSLFSFYSPSLDFPTILSDIIEDQTIKRRMKNTLSMKYWESSPSNSEIKQSAQHTYPLPLHNSEKERKFIQSLWTKRQLQYTHKWYRAQRKEKGKLNKIFDHMYECCIELCIHTYTTESARRRLFTRRPENSERQKRKLDKIV